MRLAASRLLASRAGYRGISALYRHSRTAASSVSIRRWTTPDATSTTSRQQRQGQRRLKLFSTSSSSSSSSPPSTSTPSSAAEELANWIESRGGRAPSERVSVFAEGASRGLALRCGSSGAKAGEALIVLPASCLLGGSSGSSPSSSLLSPEIERAVDDLSSR